MATNLAAAAYSTTQIDLTWTDNSTNETNFRIERAPDVSGGNPGTFTYQWRTSTRRTGKIRLEIQLSYPTPFALRKSATISRPH